jgi:YVTN family beta-propeller protein
MPIFGPKDGLLYVTTELDQAITLIDPKTLKIVGSIPTGQPESHMLALSHDGRRGYTANVGPGTVSVLDIAARKVLTIIPISGQHAAHCHLARRPLGLHRRPDQAATGRDRHGDQSGEQLDSARRRRLRHRAHARRPLAARHPARPRTRSPSST